MFAKHVLRAFKPETEVVYIINGNAIEDTKTVKDFMDSGLTTYLTVGDGTLEIEGNKIILRA